MSLGTKVLSVRVPFEFYINQLQQAQNMGLSISDYLVIKLNNADKSSTLSPKVEIREVDNPKLKDRISELEEQVKKWQKDYQSVYYSNRDLREENKKLSERYEKLLSVKSM